MDNTPSSSRVFGKFIGDYSFTMCVFFDEIKNYSVFHGYPCFSVREEVIGGFPVMGFLFDFRATFFLSTDQMGETLNYMLN